MGKQPVLFEGTVVDVVRNATMVRLDNGHTLRAVLSGKMMMKSIRVTVGVRIPTHRGQDSERSRTAFR